MGIKECKTSESEEKKTLEDERVVVGGAKSRVRHRGRHFRTIDEREGGGEEKLGEILRRKS